MKRYVRGAWAVWFEGDDVPNGITEIHDDELEALRSAFRQVPAQGEVVHFKPRVTFVPYGMAIDEADRTAAVPVIEDEVAS